VSRIIQPETSQSSPLRIAEVLLEPGEGILGMTLCPGKKDSSCNWNRDLREDLMVILAWGASSVVTLIEEHEFEMLAIEGLGRAVQELGMDWMHLPIRDVDVPDDRFEQAWKVAGALLHRRLDMGEHILIHCRGGLGRTGLVAGLILVERGSLPQDAIDRVRAVRPHAIETRAQENYVISIMANQAERYH
jgi:ADP-ribosyl-[dinitrogen reductase] hydrolase